MSTFPTAFWKDNAAPVIVEDLDINWATSLAGSYGDQPVDEDDFPLTPLENFVWTMGDINYSEGNGITSPGFPFIVNNDGAIEVFYSSYSDSAPLNQYLASAG